MNPVHSVHSAHISAFLGMMNMYSVHASFVCELFTCHVMGHHSDPLFVIRKQPPKN